MGKVLSLEEVLEEAANAKRHGKTVVATNGCFDILHVGHVRNLAAAKKLGDVLIVGVNSDASVRANKGVGRPIVPAKERTEIIAALSCVDYAFTFAGRTPFSWIAKLKPDVHVKGGGADVRAHKDFPTQKEVVERSGGKLVLLPHHAGKSTTNIIRTIENAATRASTARSPRRR